MPETGRFFLDGNPLMISDMVEASGKDGFTEHKKNYKYSVLLPVYLKIKGTIAAIIPVVITTIINRLYLTL